MNEDMDSRRKPVHRHHGFWESFRDSLGKVKDRIAIYDDVSEDTKIYLVMSFKQSCVLIIESVTLLFVLVRAVCMMFFFVAVLMTVILLRIVMDIIDMAIMLSKDKHNKRK
ncbi:hypothetical protein GQ472_01590 [archaeon]|nr:hypothetical protein [archaeon]